LGSRSRRHAHRHAPGGVPGRGHLGSTPARGGGAAPDRTVRIASAERPHPGGRPGGAGKVIATKSSLEFTVPQALEATEPPEERGQGRDDVRLLVSQRSSGKIEHHRFGDLLALLRPGDLLVFNRSAPLNAALDATFGSERAVVHVARRLSDTEWIAELRYAEPDSLRTTPWLDARAGTEIALRGGGRAILRRPAVDSDVVRLWVVEVALDLSADEYLLRWGRP